MKFDFYVRLVLVLSYARQTLKSLRVRTSTRKLQNASKLLALQLTCKARIPRRLHRHRRRHAYILTSDTSDFLKLFLWQTERTTRRHSRDDPREDVGDDVGVGSWNAGLTARTSSVVSRKQGSTCCFQLST